MKNPRTKRPQKTDWAEHIREHVEWAKHSLAKTGRIIPQYLIATPRKVYGITVACEDEDEHERITEMLGIFCLAGQAESVTFVFEAWKRNLTRRPGETMAEFLARGHAVPPSQAEDRQEVVIVQCIYYDEAGERRSIGTDREILRDADGRAYGLGEEDQRAQGGEAEGWLIDILAPERPGKEAVMAAIQMLPIAAEVLGIKIEKLGGDQ